VKTQKYQSTASKRLLQAPDAFKQTLLKYSARHLKTGTSFAVLCAHLNNYESLRRDDEEALRHWLISFEQEWTNSLREMDRVSVLSPDYLLVLLPETDEASANLVRARLEVSTRTLSSQLIGVRRPQVEIRMSHSDTVGGDVELLLQHLNCCIDEHGQLVPLRNLSGRLSTGALSVWQARYQVSKKKTQSSSGSNLDTFSNNKKWSVSQASWCDLWDSSTAVLTLCAESKAGQLEGVHRESMIIKARTLQGVDHPNVLGCLDFFIEGNEKLFLVLPARELTPIEQWMTAKKNSIEPAVAAGWAHELLQALIYLHTLVPPVIPSKNLVSLLFVDQDQSLVVSNFHLPYLLDELESATNELALRDFASAMQLLFKSTKSAPPEVNELVEKLLSQKVPEEINTLYKLRTVLKRINARLSETNHADK
jgi:hypothetical protein